MSISDKDVSDTASVASSFRSAASRSSSIADLLLLDDPLSGYEIIDKIRSILSNIQKDKRSRLSTTSNKSFKSISKMLLALTNDQIHKDKQLTLLEQSNREKDEAIQNLRSLYQDVIQKLPSSNLISELIATQINNFVSSIQEKLDRLNQSLNNSLSSTFNASFASLSDKFAPFSTTSTSSPVATSETVASASSQPNSFKNPFFSDSQSPSSATSNITSSSSLDTRFNRAEKSTIILKSCGNYRLSGKQILAELNKIKVCSSISIKNVRPLRSVVEIECFCSRDADLLKKELKKNNVLNKFLNFTTKSLPLQRSIVLGVPNVFSEEEIKSRIMNLFACSENELVVLRQQKTNSSDFSNWIVLLPPSLLSHIINLGGVLFGLKRCLFRPHTYLPRCQKCQFLGHSSRQCPNLPVCDTCGEEHSSNECTSTSASCFNCLDFNNKNNTNFKTNHKTSDQNCPTYKELYTQLRSSLNQKFPVPPNATSSTKEAPFPAMPCEPSHKFPKTSAQAYGRSLQNDFSSSYLGPSNFTATSYFTENQGLGSQQPFFINPSYYSGYQPYPW